MTDVNWPVSCERDAAMDRNHLFRVLRERWMNAKPGRIGTDLCQFLGVRKQLVSSYGTGTDGRRPPLWVLMRLCQDLNLELRMTPDGIVVTRRRVKSGSPATRKDDTVVAWTTLT